MDIQFQHKDGEKRHKCNARREQDWVIFTCQLCPGFERRIHMPTGQVKVQHGVDPWILHEGKFIAPGFDANVSTAN